MNTTKRIALLGIIMLTVTAITATASAYTLVMDAAELDRDGNELALPGVLPIIDNRAGTETLTDVWFEIHFTGQTDRFGGWTWDDPANPWYGLFDTGLSTQYVNGRYWRMGTIHDERNGRFGPVFSGFLNPDFSDDDGGVFLLNQIPAGILWASTKFLGPDVVFFHSPAEGALEVNGETIAVSDDDRRPQLVVPEPATLTLLAAAGCAGLLRRKD
jgi:hypothetical protein